MNAQAREFTIRQKHIGIGLIVAQQNVVRRAPFLDKRLLKQQRLGFIGGNGGFYLRDTCHEGSCFRRQAGFAKVAGQTLFQVLGLTHVKQPCIAVKHAIHARTTAAGRKKRTCVKHVSHR